MNVYKYTVFRFGKPIAHTNWLPVAKFVMWVARNGSSISNMPYIVQNWGCSK